MLLLSIHPTYVERIFGGTKSIELRKRRPNVEIGSKVVIYSTMPECRIVGFATIGDITSCSPSYFWRINRSQCGVSKKEFDSYFADAALAVGIHLESPVEFKDGFSLDTLRHVWPGFHPPQQYQYLTDARVDLLFSV